MLRLRIIFCIILYQMGLVYSKRKTEQAEDPELHELIQKYKRNNEIIEQQQFDLKMSNLKQFLDNENPREFQEEPIIFYTEDEQKEIDNRNEYIKNNFLNKEEYLQSLVQKQANVCNLDPLVIPVFNRPVEIGDYYDARSSQLRSGQRSWSSDDTLSNAKLVTQQAPNSVVSYTVDKAFDSDFDSMDATLSIKLEFLFGAITIGGSAGYFKERKGSVNIERGVYTQQMTTVHEKVRDLSEINYINGFSREDVTHIVTGITYGCDARTVFEYVRTSYESKQKIWVNLSASMSLFGAGVSMSVGISTEESLREFQESTTIRTYADVVYNGELPNTMDQAVQFMRQVPTLLQNYNGGKGKPMYMTLTPLCLAKQNKPSDQSQINTFYQELKQNLMDQFVKEYEQLNEVNLELNELKTQFKTANQHFYTEQKQREFENFFNGFLDFKDKKEAYIREIMRQYKSGDDTEANKQTTLLNELKANSLYNYPNSLTFLDKQKKDLLLKIESLNQFQKKYPKLNFIDKNVWTEIGEPTTNKIILYTSIDKIISPDDNTIFFEQIYFYLTPDNTEYYLVFIDALTAYNTKSGDSYIEYYESQGKFMKNLKQYSGDYVTSTSYYVALEIDKNDDIKMKQLFYRGWISRDEAREGYGELYKNAEKVKELLKNQQIGFLKSNLIYEGQWSSDVFSGKGTIYDIGGFDECTGNFSNGKTNGFLTCKKGDFKGEFNKFGQKQGKGTVVLPVQAEKFKCVVLFNEEKIQKVFSCKDKNDQNVSDLSNINVAVQARNSLI